METREEKVDVRRGLWMSAAVLGVMVLASLWGAAQLPEGGSFPVHWNIHGKPDRYGSRWEVLALIPVITAFTSLLLSVVPRLEPRAEHMRRSMKAYQVIWLGTLLVLLVVHLSVIAAALGHKPDMMRVTGVTTGLLLVAIGNYLGKIRSNFFAGVRTPWTLSSELSWNKTHRLAGKLFVVLGLLMAGTPLLGTPWLFLAVMAGLMPTALAWIVVYSYLVWKRDPNRAA